MKECKTDHEWVTWNTFKGESVQGQPAEQRCKKCGMVRLAELSWKLPGLRRRWTYHHISGWEDVQELGKDGAE